MSGGDRSGMREKMTLLNVNEESLTQPLPLLDLARSVNSRRLLRGWLMCQRAGAAASSGLSVEQTWPSAAEASARAIDSAQPRQYCLNLLIA